MGGFILLCLVGAYVTRRLIQRARRKRVLREARILAERVNVLALFAYELLIEREVAIEAYHRMLHLFCTEVALEERLLADVVIEVADEIAKEYAAQYATKIQAKVRGNITRHRGMPLVAMGTVARRKAAVLKATSESRVSFHADHPSTRAISNFQRISHQFSEVQNKHTVLNLMLSGQEDVVEAQPSFQFGHQWLMPWLSHAASERKNLQEQLIDAATRMEAAWRRHVEVDHFHDQRRAAVRIQARVRANRARRLLATMSAAAALAAAPTADTAAAGLEELEGLPVSRKPRRPTTRQVTRQVRKQLEADEKGRKVSMRGHILRDVAGLALAHMEKSQDELHQRANDAGLRRSLAAFIRQSQLWDAEPAEMADDGIAAQLLVEEFEARDHAREMEQEVAQQVARLGGFPEPAKDPSPRRPGLRDSCVKAYRHLCCKRPPGPPSQGEQLWNLLLTLIDEAKTEAPELDHTVTLESIRNLPPDADAIGPAMLQRAFRQATVAIGAGMTSLKQWQTQKRLGDAAVSPGPVRIVRSVIGAGLCLMKWMTQRRFGDAGGNPGTVRTPGKEQFGNLRKGWIFTEATCSNDPREQYRYAYSSAATVSSPPPPLVTV